MRQVAGAVENNETTTKCHDMENSRRIQNKHK